MLTVLYIVLMIGGLIFVHELGHYLAARRLGVHVVEFSIGFGPRLWTIKGKQKNPALPPTEYIIAALPVGGYVRMLGADPTEEVPDEVHAWALNYKPVWRRFVISLAGPGFNLLLPLVVFFFVGLATDATMPSVAGTVDPGHPAWAAGIRPGDRITEVAGEPVRYFAEEMAPLIEDHPGEEIDIAWEHLGEIRRGKITPRARVQELIPGSSVMARTVGKIGVGATFVEPIIAVTPGSQAEAAGLRTWDRIVTIDGEAEPYLTRALQRIEAAAGRAVELGVVRYHPEVAGNLALALGDVEKVTLPPATGAADRGVFSAECVVEHAMPGSPADKAGVRRGDRILAVDAQACDSWLFTGDYLDRKKVGEDFTLTLDRAGERVTATLAKVEVPWPMDLQPDAKRAIHGIETRYATSDPAPIPVENRFSYAIDTMLSRTGQSLQTTVGILGGLFTGKVSVKEGLGGPVLIAQITARAASNGLESFFKLMAVLSVSLGLINLLPIPVLDGGTMMFLAIEGIRRKPVSMRVRMIATYMGLAFIVVLMVIVLRNDLNRGCGGVGMLGGFWP